MFTNQEQSKTILDLRKRTDVLDTALKEKDCALTELRVEVAAIEQYSRCKKTEIHEIQKADSEDFLEEVNNLAVKLRLPVPSAQDIEAVYRLPFRVGTGPFILITFTKKRWRDLWIPKSYC